MQPKTKTTARYASLAALAAVKALILCRGGGKVTVKLGRVGRVVKKGGRVNLTNFVLWNSNAILGDLDKTVDDPIISDGCLERWKRNKNWIQNNSIDFVWS